MPSENELIFDINKAKQFYNERSTGTIRRIDAGEMAQALRQRVRGQDPIINDVAKLIRFNWGRQTRSRPIASMLCLGPPGTGKSELAKALAEYLYQDEKNALVFDGPDLSGPESKVSLLGTPDGYVGAERGGKLTRPIINNPRQVIVFEEIEKAYKEVFDLFLAMLGDGRLTETGSGTEASFKETVIILTGNAEYAALSRIAQQVSDAVEQSNAIKQHLVSAKVLRPEILDRIDRVYLFQPLKPEMLIEIGANKAAKLAKDYGLTLVRLEEELIGELVLKLDKFQKPNKVRELIRLLEETLGEPLLKAQEAGLKRVAAVLNEQGDVTILSE